MCARRFVPPSTALADIAAIDAAGVRLASGERSTRASSSTRVVPAIWRARSRLAEVVGRDIDWRRRTAWTGDRDGRCVDQCDGYRLSIAFFLQDRLLIEELIFHRPRSIGGVGRASMNMRPRAAGGGRDEHEESGVLPVRWR